MIFVSVGTERFPFDRLIRAVDQLASALRPELVVVQLGHGAYLPRNCEWVRFLPYPELVRKIESADAVITHAGAGSILLCIRAGKTPLVVPRMKHFGEHVDNHQLELARRVAEEGRVLLLEDVGQIHELVQRLKTLKPLADKSISSEHSLAGSLAVCLEGEETKTEWLQAVWSYYPLSSPVGFRQTKKGFANETWFVQIAEGRRVVLRRYPRNVQEAWIRQEYSLLSFLKRNGFPAPGIIETSSGKPFVQIEGRHYVLLEYCEGKSLIRPIWRRLALDVNRQAGKTLAQFHLLMKDFRSGDGGEVRSPIDAEVHLRRLGSYRDIAARSASNVHHRYYLQHAEEARKRLENLIPVIQHQLALFNKTVIHDDFGPSNVLYKRGQLRGVIDFANAKTAPRVMDVAYALTEFSKWFGARLYLGIAEVFLNAYQREYPLEQQELEFLPTLMRYLRLRSLGWFLMQYFEKNRRECAGWFLDSLELVRWMESHGSEIQAICSPKNEKGVRLN